MIYYNHIINNILYGFCTCNNIKIVAMNLKKEQGKRFMGTVGGRTEKMK